MFDTPNGQKFLGLLSRMVHALELTAERMNHPTRTVKVEDAPWRQIDQLAWELFRDTLNEDRLASESYTVVQTSSNRAINHAYELAALFMAQQRARKY